MGLQDFEAVGFLLYWKICPTEVVERERERQYTVTVEKKRGKVDASISCQFFFGLNGLNRDANIIVYVKLMKVLEEVLLTMMIVNANICVIFG